MWIERSIEKLIAKMAEQRPALLLTGCRQTGKTSLLKKMYPGYPYTSLDIPLHAEEAEVSGHEFLRKLGEPVIIDEIQYAPGLMRHLKTKIDENRDRAGRFFLTGSQKFPLMQGVTESLAGRITIVTCHSLSLLELEKHRGVLFNREDLLECIIKGGYPELHSRNLEPHRFYGDYLATYLERDVRQIINVASLRDFDRFLRLLALRSGQILSMNALASDVGVSSHTIKSWVSVLETSNIIYLLEPYYRNLGKRAIKSPKVYFLDTGLLVYLLGIRSVDELASSALLGGIFETLALGQIVRAYAHEGLQANLFFYRDHGGHEIDFVIPVGERLKLIECKWSAEPAIPHRPFLDMEKLIGSANIISKTIITSERETRNVGHATTLSSCVDVGGLVK